MFSLSVQEMREKMLVTSLVSVLILAFSEDVSG